jgi:hypothetical protein
MGDLGRVEIGADELERALSPSQRAAIGRAVLAAGYAKADVSETPFRSGSLNLIASR